MDGHTADQRRTSCGNETALIEFRQSGMGYFSACDSTLSILANGWGKNFIEIPAVRIYSHMMVVVQGPG
jgi:hypothetical protein